MTDTVYWVLEVSVKDGQIEPLKELMGELVDRTQSTEPDTLVYEWLINKDRSKIHIYERYADSAAALNHLATFTENYAERFMNLVDPVWFTVYGNPNDEVRGAIAGFNPTYMNHLGGFAR